MAVSVRGRAGGWLPAGKGQIEHIVVLMLENQSYDRLLGALHGVDPLYRGVQEGATIPQAARHGGVLPVTVRYHRPSSDGGRPAPWRTDPDPGHLFEDVLEQTTGGEAPAGYRTLETLPTAMHGFWKNWAGRRERKFGAPPPGAEIDAASDFLSPLALGELPALQTLATRYAVATQWFSSAPAHTWINRLFALAGTSGGRLRAVDTVRLVSALPTIFRRLEQRFPKARSEEWRIYKRDFSQALFFTDVQKVRPYVRNFGDFVLDAQAGRLASFNFVEPSHMGARRDYMHPPADIRPGDQLVAAVYNALRANPTAWRKTLLVVTFDEHGGFYDHELPPRAVPPGGAAPAAFGFDRYGVRVPAILASPLIAPGTVIADPVDHTALLRLVHSRLGTTPLSRRDVPGTDAFDTWSFLSEASGTNYAPEPLVGAAVEDGAGDGDARLDETDRENTRAVLVSVGALPASQDLPATMTYADAERAVNTALETYVARDVPGPLGALLAVPESLAEPNAVWLRDPDAPLPRATAAFLADARPPAAPEPEDRLPGIVRASSTRVPTGTGRWHVVTGRLNITPPLGTPLSGMGPLDLYEAEGYWGRLWATTYVLQDPSGERAAILALDLHAASRYLLELIAARAAPRTGLTIDRLFATAIHTHQGPGNFYGSDWYDRVAGGTPGFARAYVEAIGDDLAALLEAQCARLDAGTEPEARLGVGQTVLTSGILHNRSDVALAANFMDVSLDPAEWRGPPHAASAREVLAGVWRSINGMEAPPGFLKGGNGTPTNAGYHATRAGVDARVRVLWFETPTGTALGGLGFLSATPTFLGGPSRTCTGDVLGAAGLRMAEWLRTSAESGGGDAVPFAFAGGANGDATIVDPARSFEAFNRDRHRATSWTEIAGEVRSAEPVVEEVVRAATAAWRAAREDARSVDRLGAGRLGVAFAEPDIAEAEHAEPAWPRNVLSPSDPDTSSGPAEPSLGRLPADAEFGEPAAAASELDHQGLSLLFREGRVRIFDPLDPQSPKRRASDNVLGAIGTGIKGARHPVPFATLRRLDLGGVTLLAVPGEPSTWLAHQIEAQVAGFTGRPVFVASLAGDYLGYFVTREEYMTQQYEGASCLWGRCAGEWLRERLASLSGVTPRFVSAPFPTRVIEMTPRWTASNPDGAKHTGPYQLADVSARLRVLGGAEYLEMEGFWCGPDTTRRLSNARRAWVRLLVRQGEAVAPLRLDGMEVDDTHASFLLRHEPGRQERFWRIRWHVLLPWRAEWTDATVGFALTEGAPRAFDGVLPRFAVVRR